MRRRVVNISLFTATALFFAAQIFVAQPSTSTTTLRVDEAGTRFAILEKYASVSLAVENFSDSGVRAQIRLELLDTQGRVSAADKSDETIKAGSSAIVIPVSLVASKLTQQERSRLPWYRLRYRIIPKTNAFISSDSIEGIISLSEITPDLFDLETIGSSLAFDGMRYRARARAKHPVSSLPVRDVSVHAELSFHDAPSAGILKTSATTDSDGFAVLDLDLPPNITSREAEITVTAARGGYTREAQSEIQIGRFAEMLISVDKPIYQPGQLLHMRLLARDNLLRRAVADATLSVSITDPESTDVFRSSIKTSKNGIASLDWPIPENTRLGEYMIKVEIKEGKYEDSIAGQYVKISRYDLPNFVVTVKADRPYYLPGQDASVEVRADYIFGQSVTRGQVRVVCESGREWNYREQKWEITQTDEYKGETDRTGRFIARIKLKEEHEKLADSDYHRFLDATFAAYFTDPTTNRTEQRRFDLRVTKQAIHVYVIKGNNRQARGLPLQFYVTTFYADGSPAECELTITERSENVAQTNNRPLARLKTNRYGVAKVSNLVIAPNRDDSDKAPELIFSAQDSRARSGSHDDHYLYYERKVIRVDTEKTIHKPGEPIRAEITSSEPDVAVVCDAVSDNRVVRSEIVRLRNGRGFINFPYNDDFKDEVVIAAYLFADPYSLRIGSRKVIYPREHDLKIKVEPGQASYQPGEQANATISVTSPDGREVESALGVVVIDKAVEERARTDQEFGAGGGFYAALLGDDGLAGISRKDLDRIDLSKPQPPELDLVAEIMLNQSGSYYPDTFSTEARETDQRVLFAGTVEPQFKPVTDALNSYYKSRALYPADEAALRRLLADSGIDLDELRDPWGGRYRAVFSVESAMDTLRFESAGADKRFNTADDFVVARSSWPYFTSIGESINRAVASYHARTGGFIRDAATLKSEMRREAIGFDTLRDRWGNPYRFDFGVSQTRLTIYVRSDGADTSRAWDDFTIWTSQIDYFVETKEKISAALNNFFQTTARFPQDKRELDEALKGSGVDLNSLRDPWGNRYYATFNTDFRYADRVSLRLQSIYGSEPQHRTEVTPVTQQLRYITLRSSGPDGKQGTYDDFDAGYFSRIVAEQSAQEPTPQPRRAPVSFSSSTGAIIGSVTDAAGAVIPNVSVKATHMAMMLVYETKSNDEGRYTLSNLPSGLYQLYFEARNFKATVFTEVSVKSSSITEIDASLVPGGVTELVSVAAGGEGLLNKQTSNFSITEKGATRSPRADARMKAQISTPRLREHFPETLLWQPEIETDSKGRAQLRFKLADNITTWKMAVIASTTDGQIGVAEREIRAFQPFFVEHDPPRVLTEGDEIALPIVVRNYLDRAQPVTLEIKPESWFKLSGPARKQTEVASGDARRETFGLRALATVKDGKQRITAFGAEASDAVEKPVTVHPDGQEITQSATRLFNESATLEIDLPANTIKNSEQSELKIYPSLMAHVIESIEAILQRPYGCAEQTISSTYPSLLVLGYYKRNGEDFPPLAQTALRYSQSGYERLLGYRSESGGFSYWGRGEANLALTAYALRFLNDASEFIAVDKDVIKGARAWIIKQQQKDGSWPAPSWSASKDSSQTAMVTSFIARVLAASKTATIDPSHQTETEAALKRALDYLARPVAQVDEPYLIASYAIAAADAGEQARAESAQSRLRALARNDAGMIYWALEANTPFYGWGLAGRIETTALAVQALARDCKAQTGSCQQMIDGGLLFMLRQKDRYGIWYSTQATISVLDALVTLLPKEKLDLRSAASGSAEIFVNGRSAGSVALPPADKPSGPVTVSISGLLSTGKNLIEVRRSGSSPATAQAVASYYVPWTAASVNDGVANKGGLRLGVRFDKTAARVGDEVTCKVEAERVGFSGYGMMLAEIGLPPGAEVDRASLDRAMVSTAWELNQYDVLPDRVIVYLWPRAGGTRFEFKFRPRFGLAAQSAFSMLYDYYNPEARAVVAPAKFLISER